MNKRQGSRITKSSLNQIALEAAAKAGYCFSWESTQYPFWDQLGFSAVRTSELESFKSGIVAWLDKWAIAYKDGARIDKESFKAIFRASIGADDNKKLLCCLNQQVNPIGIEDSISDPVENLYQSNPQIFRQEKEIQSFLHQKMGGQIEVPVQFGRIDLLVNRSVWEIKHVSCWKHALGQVLAYGYSLPGHKLYLTLFGVSIHDVSNLSAVHDVCALSSVSVTAVVGTTGSYTLIEIPLSRNITPASQRQTLQQTKPETGDRPKKVEFCNTANLASKQSFLKLSASKLSESGKP